MKKVLFIAYYFPPIGGGGVQRSLKFAKYLPNLGYMPHVLSAGRVAEEHWSPRDEALLADLPPGVRISRIDGLPASEVRSWNRRMRDVCQLPSRFGAAWANAVLREGARLCAEHAFDLIYVSMSPFEGAAAAASLSRRFGIPWVADLRDPWALDEVQVFYSGVHRRIARSQMRRALADASLVIMNTPEAARRLVTAFPEYRKKNVTSLTNGYDAADYDHLTWQRDDHFRIVHTGSLHARHGRQLAARRRLYERLGRIEPGVDLLSRSHVFLLEALRLWQARDARVARQVRLILAGSLTSEDRRMVERSAARGLVTLEGYRTHQQTARLQVDAEVLFLPMHQVAPNRRATIVPGKTYEYLATRRPILAAVPQGDARDFVTEAQTGFVCGPADVEGMVAHLKALHQAWLEHRDPVKPRDEVIVQFERQRLTTLLAGHFDEVLDNHRAGLRSMPLPSHVRSDVPAQP